MVSRLYTGNKLSFATRLIGDIHQELLRQLSKSNHMVSHYMTTYGDVPLLVLVNVLTYGKITMFYRCMKEDDKKKISKHFNFFDFELHKYMELLGIARNKCAHDERFFDIRFKNIFIQKV